MIENSDVTHTATHNPTPQAVGVMSENSFGDVKRWAS